MKSWEDIPIRKLVGGLCENITENSAETTFQFSDGSSIMVITENDCVSVIDNGAEKIGLSGASALIGNFIYDTKILHNDLHIFFKNNCVLVLHYDDSMFESFIFEISGHTYSV